MSVSHQSFLAAAQRCALYATLVLVVGGAMAQPAQSPLLSRSGGGVAPNVVLDLDDSGSMMYQHMPENEFVLGGRTINLGGDQSAISHPSDTRYFTNIRGVYPANVNATGTALNYQQMVRSPDVNSLYYNPEITYLPWRRSDGTRFPAAAPNGASFDPLVTAAVGAAPAVTYIGAGTASNGASGAMNPGLPAFVQNDFLLCLTESYDLVVPTAPAGWTRIYSRAGSATHQASAFYKMADAAETAPVFGHTGGSSWVARCFSYRNVDFFNPFDVDYADFASATQNLLTVGTATSGTVTTANAGSMVVMAVHAADNFTNSSITVASGLTWSGYVGASRDGTGAADVGISVHNAIRATSGAVGPVVATTNGQGRTTGVLLALRRSASAAPVTNGVNLLAPSVNVQADWCFNAINTNCASSTLSYTPMLFTG